MSSFDSPAEEPNSAADEEHSGGRAAEHIPLDAYPSAPPERAPAAARCGRRRAPRPLLAWLRDNRPDIEDPAGALAAGLVQVDLGVETPVMRAGDALLASRVAVMGWRNLLGDPARLFWIIRD